MPIHCRATHIILTTVETALVAGEKRRESNIQAKRRSIIGAGGGAGDVGAGDVGAGGGDDDGIDEKGLFVLKAQTDAEKAAKRTWS